jgi:diacylglycerol kinase (ATP)
VAGKVSRVVAWGGDGTVNEVAGPLIGTGVALGIVPGGSGDGTAASLGLSRPVSVALEQALTAEPARVDVGWLGSRHFLNVAGIGFDAEVASAFNRQRRRGLPGYLRVGLPLFWTYAPGLYRLNLANETLDGRMMLIAFANGPQYGNGLVLAPDAKPGDGLLNIVAVRATSRVRFLWQSRLLLFPTDRSTPGVDRRKADTCTVSGAALVCHVDGESFEAPGPLTVRIQPAALWVAGAAAVSRPPAAPAASGDRQ